MSTDLIRDADVAMYAAKKGAGSPIAIFDRAMRERTQRRLSTREDLRRAIETDALQVHYQPICRTSDLAVNGFEALVRWNHPTHGWLAPDDFVPLAEESGLVSALGAWVLQTATSQTAAWRASGRNVYVSVNLSARQLTDPGLVTTVEAAHADAGLDASALWLELTESALAEDADAAGEVLRRLRSIGVRVAIDDFGTGYSSLARLANFEVSALKIDRSFVASMTSSGPDGAIVKAVVALADELGLYVVAEGVESAEQLEVLRALGCDLAQGFLLGRPTPPGDAAFVVEKNARTSPTAPSRSLAPMTDAPVRPDLDVRRLSGSLGAEVRGLPLTDATSADAEAIHQLLLEHMVLFFPDQHLSPDEHIAFGRHFGTLESHPNLTFEAERPEFFELRAEDGAGAVADEWHSDISFEANPSRFAILQVKECPEVGGDTLWANAAKAYDELSPPLRELCDGLTALHDAGPHLRADKTHIHPVVRVHPETGRRSLFVNEHFTRRIVELSDAESAMLLPYLCRWIHEPRFTVRYRWAAGTVAMWDNRTTQHHVLNDFRGVRAIQRVTVMGDAPEAAEPSRWPAHGSQTAAFWRDTSMRQQLKHQQD